MSRRAESKLDRLGSEDRKRILAAVEELARDPFAASHVTTLFHPRERLFRKRVGPLRIVFSVDVEHEVVLVVALGRRADVYRNL
ncbi:MAG: type II toxin-antitoxin system RelE/ParE family toxin [Bacteroidota bacterium]